MKPTSGVVYIVRPELETVQKMVQQMQLQDRKLENFIVFIPRRTIECDELLEANGLLTESRIQHFSLDLLQLEEDLLSMELPRSFANHLLDDDDSYKVYVQFSLQRIEQVFGRIKYKFGKGPVSTTLVNRLNQLNAMTSFNQQQQNTNDSEIDCLIMIDRTVDLISPFCTQQTYEGQIDETFGIKTNSVDIDCNILSSNYKPEPGQPTKETKKLSSEDIIFRQIRDKAYDSLGFFFKEKIQQFESAIDKSQNAVANI